MNEECMNMTAQTSGDTVPVVDSFPSKESGPVGDTVPTLEDCSVLVPAADEIPAPPQAPDEVPPTSLTAVCNNNFEL